MNETLKRIRRPSEGKKSKDSNARRTTLGLVSRDAKRVRSSISVRFLSRGLQAAALRLSRDVIVAVTSR